jgi:hypothetical protein
MGRRLLFGGMLALCCRVLVAQPSSFGSADDPAEHIPAQWWHRQHTADLFGGLSWIGGTGYAATHTAATFLTRPFTLRLDGTFHARTDGLRTPDADEPYDALRLLAALRYNAPPASDFYLRAGPLERTRLGTGQVVNFLSSQAVWDERTVGVEMQARHRWAEWQAFTTDVRLTGVTGARIGVQPLAFAQTEPARTLQLGFGLVTDRATWHQPFPVLTAWSADARLRAFRTGAFTLNPFVSLARYTHYGRGLHFGADFETDNLLDLARFRFRLAMQYNSRRFIPGYVGAFYLLDNPATIGTTMDVPLAASAGEFSRDAELRLLLFDRLEAWYFHRRHYGYQPLGEYHLRLFWQTPNLRLRFSRDWGEATGWFTLASRDSHRALLALEAAYRLHGPLWLQVEARHTYAPLPNAPDGTRRYTPQRRYTPVAGLRMTW